LAAIEAMMIGMLPPAGDPVVLAHDADADRRLRQRWQPYHPVFYASGTAALAAAVSAALAARPGRAEVVLPGYGCPALVSAVLHAGGRPVLVDLAPGLPWLALDALESAVGPDTAAVVGANFLGIPERLSALSQIAHATGALLIEDSAQAYPASGVESGEADLAILSFGRGKPVSLLGGGAVLSRDPNLAAALPAPAAAADEGWRPRAKAVAYNWLRRPQLYWIPQMLPLGLGETRYQPLERIDAMDTGRVRALGRAVEAYEGQAGERHRELRERLSGLGDGIIDLAAVCAPERRLLRYPLLAPSPAVRDRLLQRLTRAGLGASFMYGNALPDVPGIPEVSVHADLAGARDFARRVLTLPVHQGVRPAHLDEMCLVMGAVLQEGEQNVADYQTEKT
jgi:dTDP-4-amino-4,6-dideoxygalactose transaminase